MKGYKYISYLLILFSLTAFVACKDDAKNAGDGYLAMRMGVAMPMGDAGEGNVPDVLSDSCRVRIYNNKGLVRYYKGLNEVPATLPLAVGEYTIKAVTGDSVPATFHVGFYKGECNVTIEGGKTTSANLTCKVVNTLVKVGITDKLNEILSDYQVEVSSSKASLLFTAANADSVGYFILPNGEDVLNWTITGIKTDGDTYSQSGVLRNVKGSMRYDLTFDFNESEYNMGGAYFNLLVDEQAVEKVDNIVIYKRPDIECKDHDITKPIVFEENAGNAVAIDLRATSAMTQVVVSGENLEALGLPANIVDFVAADEETLGAWNAAGVTFSYEYDETNDISMGMLVFSESFVRTLPEGANLIDIRVADMHAKQWQETLNITITNAVVLTDPTIRHETWAKRATLYGTVLRETEEAITFQYRAVGSAEWNSIEAVRNENALSAELTDLQPGTTYEYRAVAGTMPSSVILEFTTEEAFALPNAGFENWHKNGSVWMVCGQGEEVWWDTGNHGSATLNVNITNQDTNIKHSGNSSIKMQSQYVSFLGIGKFAAGNVFAGVYAGTEGTNGILDMGRPCSSRPAKLKGYIKYQNGTVDYSSTDLMPKGSTDIGDIYVALGDWSAPVHITTKDQNFFSRDDEKIIGFGEMVLPESTEGDGLIPFTIDIEYRSLTRIPTYIVLVASASYYGDYFTGSSSSVMWLDDLELVYE